nr:adenylosuccinate synthetase [Pelagibacterales bacterium]
GSGPFPTELDGEAADALREAGQEYGSVTGRPRRVGWLDLPLLRYARDINNIHSLVVTKLDVLSGLDEIKVCTFYGNQKRNEYPINVIDDAGPKYVTLPGWNDDISNVKSLEELPVNARNYIEFIEENLDIPISLISVGADRNCIIDRRDYVSDFYSKKVMENIKPAVNEQLTDLYTILNRAASKLDELEQTKAEEN